MSPALIEWSSHSVEYLIVGGHAVAFHGHEGIGHSWLVELVRIDATGT